MFLKKIYKHVIMETINKLFLVSYPFSNSFILQFFQARIGRNARIYSPLIFHNTNFRNLSIGDNCHIGRCVFLDLVDRISIGNNITISMKCTFITHTDLGNSPLVERGYPPSSGEIIIEDGVYIGVGATVLQGVRIGENSIIGACALVSKNVPPNSVVAGVPAKTIRTL